VKKTTHKIDGKIVGVCYGHIVVKLITLKEKQIHLRENIVKQTTHGIDGKVVGVCCGHNMVRAHA